MRRTLIALFCLLVLVLSACGGETAGAGVPAPGGAVSSSAPGTALEQDPPAEERKPAEEPQPPEEELEQEQPHVEQLTDAPKLTLVWEDGGEAELLPSSYSWSYSEGGEMVSFVACGLAPGDALEYLEPIVLPNGFLEHDCIAPVCALECVVVPDQVTIRCWDEGAEKPAVSETYDSYGSVELELGHDSYEIVAVWSEDHLEWRGFYGEANYIFRLQAP